jgi:two-component system phosphate regulon response regulator OmpR
MDCHTETARCTSVGRPSVLIVDDEAAVRRMLSTYFSENGFRTESVGSGTEMVGCLDAGRYDLVLLDLNMGSENGLDFLRVLNSPTRPPIIIISARKHPVDKVVGLELGAEDYIGKPFHLREVLARARKALRNAKDRAGQASPAGLPHHADDTADSDTIVFEGWQLSPKRRRLLAPDGSEVHLTSGEFAILLVFVQNSGIVLSRTQLMDATHGPGFSAYDRSIDAQVSRLRKKMQARPEWPDLFKPVRGAGYIFAARIERRRCRAA